MLHALRYLLHAALEERLLLATASASHHCWQQLCAHCVPCKPAAHARGIAGNITTLAVHHAGFVLVKKVPGTLHFTARGDGHSFDHAWMNMTHAIHNFYLGARPTPRKFHQLKRLHPMGLDPNWMDKLHEQLFFSDHPQHTHEHYLQVGPYCHALLPCCECILVARAAAWTRLLVDAAMDECAMHSHVLTCCSSSRGDSSVRHHLQTCQPVRQAPIAVMLLALQVVLTTVQPKDGHRGGVYDAYEYIAHSHTYMSDAVPTAKFTYDLSPIQIVVKEENRKWYHFLTTTCAIVGGVFTIAGVLDSILYSTIKLAKKVELGKQG
jgi:hypothetical protein